VILEMMGDGRLHLTGIAMLAPYLTVENRDTLLKRATHRTKHQIEELIAELLRRPDVPGVIRKLPDRPELRPDGVGGPELGPDAVPILQLRPDAVGQPALELRPDAVALPAPVLMPPAVVQPLSPGRYKVQFTASAQLKEKLERLRALMRSRVPDGDLAAIIEEAVAEKLERLEARRFAKVSAPRKGLPETNLFTSSRYIPAPVRRAVSRRDGNRCRYVDSQGRRCPERDRLEYHHRFPYALGVDHSPKNICLMCQTHNAYLAERDYGKEAMDRHRSSGRSPGVQGALDDAAAGQRHRRSGVRSRESD
jgi:hypothetical protein